MNRRHHQKGLTLIELMVAMVLGLVVVGGVISVLMANKKSYRTNEGLSQIQETARTAFELVARDVRQAGGTGCDNARRMANTLNTGTEWWQNWMSIQGYDGGETDPAVASSAAIGERVNDTDSLQLQGVAGGTLPLRSHDAPGGVLHVNATVAPFAVGDVMIVCDFDQSTMFQATGFDPDDTDMTVTVGTGSGTPGNCVVDLGFPTDCAAGTANVHVYQENAQIARLYAVDWYIGNNGRDDDGGRSLYRVRLGTNGAMVTEEVVSGVTDMQIQYGRNGFNDVVDGSTLIGAAAWAPVNSVFITLRVQSSDQRVTTDATLNQGRIDRTFTYLITLRNRVP